MKHDIIRWSNKQKSPFTKDFRGKEHSMSLIEFSTSPRRGLFYHEEDNSRPVGKQYAHVRGWCLN